MKITIKNLQEKLPLNPRRLKKAILRVLSKERIRKSGEITVCFVNDQKIKELNFRYLKKNIATDVLSFDYSGSKGEERILADIIISTDTVLRNAKIFKTLPSSELYLYLIHGLLHLLGYDDSTQRQRQLMRKKERTYVNT